MISRTFWKTFGPPGHPTYSARKLAEVIGITPKAIEKHLAKLKSEDVIKREGPDKGGYWTVL